jgi:hypothetical protein
VYSAPATDSEGEYCRSFYIIYAVILAINLLWFSAVRPFRIPLLNMTWLAARVTEITLNALQAYWHYTATTPFNRTAISIQLCATVLLVMNACFVGYSLLVILFEYSLRSKEIIGNVVLIESQIASGIKAVVNHIAGQEDDEGQGGFRDEALDTMLQELDELYGPVATQNRLRQLVSRAEPEGCVGGNNTINPRSPAESRGARFDNRNDDDDDDDVEEGFPRHTPSRRAVLELEPLPPTFTDKDLRLLLSVWSATVTDIRRIGRVAFVGVLNPDVARSLSAALNGRMLLGTTVSCRVIEDAFQL